MVTRTAQGQDSNLVSDCVAAITASWKHLIRDVDSGRVLLGFRGEATFRVAKEALLALPRLDSRLRPERFAPVLRSSA